jgi:quinol-cytochrome oxidoreductase complex cytochrome b subunit
MGLPETLNKNVIGFGVLVIGIVIVSIVLLKFKDVDGVTSGLNTTIDTTVSAIDEPVAWISIVIIAVVGFAVLGLFKMKKG